MPIIVNLDVVLAQRKMRLSTVAEQVGITIQNLSVLKTGKAKAIRFSTLEKLCEVLNCQPGELLVYEPEGGSGTKPVNSPKVAGAGSHDETAI
jgi:putative transcriptional regulator